MFANKNLNQTFLTNKQKNILRYVNIMLCSKLLNNNFQHNSTYQHLIKASEFWQNKELKIFLCQLGSDFIKAYVAAEGQDYWQTVCTIYKYMVNYEYTDQLVAMKPLRRNEKLRWNEALCRNVYTNKLNDSRKFECLESLEFRNFKILRIVEFGLKLLGCSEKPTIWTWNAKLLEIEKSQYWKLVQDSSWFNTHWTASTVLENWIKSLGKQGLIYTYFFLTKVVTA